MPALRNFLKMTKIHNVSSWSEYTATAEECQVRVSKVFSYFYGNEEPSTKKSWCPDCVLADPIIKEALKHVSANVEVIRVAVGERSAWKDPGNVYRKELFVKCIPTIIKFVNGKEASRLEDMDCAAPEKLSNFLQN
jgi:thiol-disulfide isomerase/thioredoxin